MAIKVIALRWEVYDGCDWIGWVEVEMTAAEIALRTALLKEDDDDQE